MQQRIATCQNDRIVIHVSTREVPKRGGAAALLPPDAVRRNAPSSGLHVGDPPSITPLVAKGDGPPAPVAAAPISTR